MQCISRPSQLATLPLSTALKAFLDYHLIDQPFGTLDSAEQFWQRYPTQLLLLVPSDQLDTLSNQLPAAQLYQLTHVPEYVLNTPDNHILALSITDPSGNGCYLLFPGNTQIEALLTLKRLAE